MTENAELTPEAAISERTDGQGRVPGRAGGRDQGPRGQERLLQPGLGDRRSSGSTSRAGRRTTTTTSARSPTTSATSTPTPRTSSPTPRTSCCRTCTRRSSADIRHTDLLIRFARGLRHHARARRGPGQHERRSPAACRPGATRWRCASTSSWPPRRWWSASSRRCRQIYSKQIVPLREKYGFTEDEIEFFDLHITSDEVHGERGYQIVLEHADTAGAAAALPADRASGAPRCGSRTPRRSTTPT